MARTAKEYEKIIDELMEFIDQENVEKDKRIKVRTDADLRKYLKLADKYRRVGKKGTQGKPRISEAFLDALARTRGAREVIGTARGSSTAPVMVFKPGTEERAEKYRAQGREVYRYDGNKYAWKEPRRSTLGTTYNVFHDVTTNRFIARKRIR